MWTSNKNNEQCALPLDSVQTLDGVGLLWLKRSKQCTAQSWQWQWLQRRGKVLVEKYPLISRHKSAVHKKPCQILCGQSRCVAAYWNPSWNPIAIPKTVADQMRQAPDDRLMLKSWQLVERMCCCSGHHQSSYPFAESFCIRNASWWWSERSHRNEMI